MRTEILEEVRESFQDFSEDLKDPRIDRCKLHKAEEMLFLSLCAIISGC